VIGLPRNPHLTGRQFEAVADVAVGLESALAPVDARAREIIRAARDRARAGEPVGPAPPELAQLDLRRREIVNAFVVRLRSRLGEAGIRQLDSYASKAVNKSRPGASKQ
jgi:hypothetical protein